MGSSLVKWGIVCSGPVRQGSYHKGERKLKSNYKVAVACHQKVKHIMIMVVETRLVHVTFANEAEWA